MSLLSVPIKSIVAWVADAQNETPPLEYAICDGRTLGPTQQDIVTGGNYTVPDLRNVFLIGADVTKAVGTVGVAVGSATIETASGAPGSKGVGGENDHQLSIAEHASHNHGGGGHSHVLTDPGHNHSISDPGHAHGVNDPSHYHTFGAVQGASAPLGTTGGTSNGISDNENTSFAHTGISIVASGTGIGLVASGTGASIVSSGNIVSTQGGDTSHENRPKYFGVVYIMKVKF